MSGVWRKTLVYLGLVEEPDEDLLDRPSTAEPAPLVTPSAASEVAPMREPSNVTPLRPVEPGGPHVRPVQGFGGRVTVVRAVTFDDAQDVGARYRSGQPVLLDLGSVDPRVGRRLLDFVSGMIYALRGDISAVGGKAFLLVPEGTDVTAEERRRLAELGYRSNA